MQGRAAGRLLGLVSSRWLAEGPAAAASAQRSAAAGAAAAAAVPSQAYYPGAAAAAGGQQTRAFSAAASAPTAKPTHNVPLGHQDSDLSSTACHIGLGRRRDLTMREDLGLWKNGTTRLTLGDVFRVRARVCAAAGRRGAAPRRGVKHCG